MKLTTQTWKLARVRVSGLVYNGWFIAQMMISSDLAGQEHYQVNYKYHQDAQAFTN